MTALIVFPVSLATAYIAFGFIHHCTASICRRHRAALSRCLPLNPPTIAPVCFGEGVELGVDVPSRIRDLKQFVRTYSLQSAVREYAGKSYGSLPLAQLTEAVQAAIA